MPDPAAELTTQGFCLLREHLSKDLLEECRKAFWPILDNHIQTQAPNRGPHRYFLPLPFEPPCFHPAFFFDPEILRIVRAAMDDRVVADQWGCDIPLQGSEYQNLHIDYQRPLFPELPGLKLPPYILVVNFGLIDITPAHGPIEIAEIPQPLALGDVLIRHPWTLHRGTPNTTSTPRPLITIRYVRRWYQDMSREVHAIPRAVWNSLTPEEQAIMRFPVST